MKSNNELNHSAPLILPTELQKLAVEEMKLAFSKAIKKKKSIHFHQDNFELDITDLRKNSHEVAHSGGYHDRMQERTADYIEGARLLIAELPHGSRKHALQLIDLIEGSIAQRFRSDMNDDALIKQHLIVIKEIEKILKNAYKPHDFPLSDPKKSLEDAANLVNWKRARPIQCTLTEKMAKNLKRRFVVQMELPIVHVTAEIRNEYRQIYSDNPPIWFLELPQSTRLLLKTHFSVPEGSEALEPGQTQKFDEEKFAEKLGTLPCTSRRYPGMTNFSNSVQLIFDEKGQCVDESIRTRSSIVVPFEIKNRSERIRLTKLNIAQLISSHEMKRQETADLWGVDVKGVSAPIGLQTLVGGLSSKLAKIAKKFGKVDKEGRMMKTADFAAEQLNDAINQPGSSNAGHYTIVRTNHPVNAIRGLKDKLKSTGRKKDNEKAFRDHLQVGITFLNMIKAKLGEEANTAIAEIESYLQYDDVKEIDPDRLEYLFNRVNNDPYITQCQDPALKAKREKNIKMLGLALSAYANLTRNPPAPTKERNFPLIRASYEQIIIESVGGINTGSCKSGKDRKGLELTHTNAMREYFELTGELPLHDNSDSFRKLFVDILARKLMSGHQERNAVMNASGCMGLKRLEKNLPKDAIKRIQELEIEEMMEDVIKMLKDNRVSKFECNLYLSALKEAFFHKAKGRLFSRNSAKHHMNNVLRPQIDKSLNNEQKKILDDVQSKVLNMANAKAQSYFLERNIKNSELNKAKAVKEMSHEHFLGKKASNKAEQELSEYEAQLDQTSNIRVKPLGQVGDQINLGQVSDNAERFRDVISELRARNDVIMKHDSEHAPGYQSR